MKKTTAILMAVLMAVSCITVAAPGIEETQAQPDYEQGDAVGIKADVSLDSILTMINTLGKEIDPDWQDLTREAAEAYIAGILLAKGYLLEQLDFDVTGQVAGMIEVAEANSNGYVLRSEYGTSARVSMDLKVTHDGETLIIQDMGLSVAMTGEGYMFLNADRMVTGINYSAKACIDMSATNNFGEEGLSAELKDSFVKLEAEFRNSSSFFEPIRFIPNGEETWSQDITYSESVTGSMGIHISQDLVESHGLASDNATEDLSSSDVEHMDLTFESEKTEEGYHVTCHNTYLPKLDTFEYDYPGNFDDIPKSFLVNGNIKLDDDGKRTVRDAIAKIQTDIGLEITDATITYLDRTGNETGSVNVKVGDSFTLPGAPAEIPRQEFLGWSDSNRNIYSGDITVRGNMTLTPCYGVSVDEKPTAAADGVLIWNTDTEGVKDQTIGNDVLRGSDWTEVVVTDGNDTLYRWKIGNNVGFATIISPEIVEFETPSDGYLLEAADGRTSLYLEFSSSGTLPGGTYVEYNVEGRFADGTSVTVYRDDGESLNYADISVVEDGMLRIEPGHCSGFLLVGGLPGDDMSDDSGNGDPMLVIVGALALVAVLAVAVLLLKRRSS